MSSDRLYVAWRLSLYGLRRGEVLGLRWSDIDLRARTLTVNQARILVEYRVRIEEPQSRNGKRTLPLDAELMAALTALRKRQPRESTIAGTAYGSGVAELDWHRGGEYVITDAAGTGVWFYLGALGATLAVGTLKAVIARHISAHQRAALSSGGLPCAAVPGSVSGARTGGAAAGLPSRAAVLAAGAGVGVSLAEATYATATATITSGITATPSDPSSKVASNTEVNGSLSITGHGADAHGRAVDKLPVWRTAGAGYGRIARSSR